MKAHTIVASLLLVCTAHVQSAPTDTKKPPAGASAKPRLLFNAYDGDAKKSAPEKMEFQINTLDVRQPSQFLKIGEVIVGTKFKLTQFNYKTRPNAEGELVDVSELTVTHTETRETLVLVYRGG